MGFSISNILHYAVLALVVLVIIVLAWLVVVLAWRWLQWRRLLKRQSVFLELTPPAGIARTPRATQELFTVLHGLQSSRSLRDKLLHRNVVLSCEITSTRQQGIRYLLQVDSKLAESVRHAITSYLPQMKVTEVPDTLPKAMQIIEFKQTGHYAFPLASVSSLEQHDPVAYLAGVMTKLATNEHVRFQIILTPVKLREATILAHKILGNEDLLAHLNGSRKLPLLPKLSQLLSDSLYATTNTVSDFYYGPPKRSSYDSSYGSARTNFERMQISTRQRPARTLSAFELEFLVNVRSW